MLLRFAADALLVLHLAFILFALCGAVLALRWPSVVRVHLPAAVWAIGIELTGAICPLTYLENALRVRAGQQGYADGFIEHYLLPAIYPAGLTPRIQIILGTAVLVINGFAYAVFIRRLRGS